MTDRELLELAAKAAGIGKLDFDYPTRESHGMYFGPRLLVPDGIVIAVTYTYWNPLTDDGDALRLAVKAGITIRKFTYKTSAIGCTQCDEYHNDAPYAATRRAIVRAAAEIGKAMK